MEKAWIQKCRSEIAEFFSCIQQYDRGEMDSREYGLIAGNFGCYAQSEAKLHTLRFRTPGGRVTLPRLKLLADIIAEYGIKRLKLTTRQCLQIHDLEASVVPAIMDAAIDVGIYTRYSGGDSVHSVMASPLSGIERGEAFDVLPYAEEAEKYVLMRGPALSLPRKLKIAFSNGVDDSVHASFRDMGFIAKPNGTFSLRVAGGIGALEPMMGIEVASSVKPEDILYYIRAMTDIFASEGDYNNRSRARSRFLQETLGSGGLRRVFLETLKQRQAAGGLKIKPIPKTVIKKEGSAANLADYSPRLIEQKQSGLYAVRYQPIGGLLPPDMPAKLYGLLEKFEETELRFGAKSEIYIINLTFEEAEKVIELTADSAATPLEQSVACVGWPTCQIGVNNSQSTLRYLIEELGKAGIPANALPPLAISGCQASCAANQSAAIGLYGCLRLVDTKQEPAYAISIGGRDKLGAACFGEPLGVVLERDLPALLIQLSCMAAEEGWEKWAPQNGEMIRSIVNEYL